MKKNEYPTVNITKILIDRWCKQDKVTIRTLAEILNFGLLNELWDADSEVSLLIETDDGGTVVGTLDDISINESIKYNFNTNCKNKGVVVKGLDLISKRRD